MLKKIFAFGAALIFFSVLNVQASDDFSNSPIWQTTAPVKAEPDLSSVGQLVEAGYGFCTVFYIGDNRFVSAGHCALDGKSPMHLMVQGGTFKFADLEIIAISSPIQAMADFSVFEIMRDKNGNPVKSVPALKDRKPLTLDCSYQAKVGDDLRVEGFPDTLGFLTTWGKVAGATEPWEIWSKPVIRTNIAVSNGDSGGPVFLEKTGKVIGILVGGLPKNQNLAVVQPITPVCQLLGLK